MARLGPAGADYLRRGAQVGAQCLRAAIKPRASARFAGGAIGAGGRRSALWAFCCCVARRAEVISHARRVQTEGSDLLMIQFTNTAY